MARILILFGSLTGHTKMVATMVAKTLQKQGKEVELVNCMGFNDYDLSKYSFLIMGSSTWDEGKLQMHFEEYLDKLLEHKPKLSGKKFAVFGCGDSTYVHFGEGLNILEQGLTGLGAEKMLDKLLVDGNPEENKNLDAITEWAGKLAAMM
jgi:flavodoxin short chain